MPIHGLSVALVTTAATKAPDSSIPSIAMFTTPARSHRTPDRAPNAIGTDRWTVVSRTPVRFIDWPAATQVRNAKTNANATRPRIIAVRAPNPRVSWMAPANATTPASR